MEPREWKSQSYNPGHSAINKVPSAQYLSQPPYDGEITGMTYQRLERVRGPKRRKVFQRG